MAKPRVEVVGADGDRVLYIQFFQDAEPMKNQLWKLQHPGNSVVDTWEESIVKRDDEGLRFSTKMMTQNFFKSCVFPVNEGVTVLEKELEKEFGGNESGKLKPDDIPPLMYGVWQKLQSRFFNGDLWSDIPEPKPKSDEGRD